MLPVLEVTSTIAVTVPPQGKAAKAHVVITTSSVLGVQGLLLIVQRKVTLPAATKPVTPLEADVGAVIVAVPLTTLHKPVPVTGTFPAKVAEVKPQAKVWSEPAAATLGTAFTVTEAVFTAVAEPQVLLAVKV
jgi:hypothetical protein